MISAESIGTDIVYISSNLFEYNRVGSIVTLELEEGLHYDTIKTIKDFIELYEDLIKYS